MASYTIQEKYRRGFLIAASLFFYAYNDFGLTINFLLLILASYLLAYILKLTSYNKYIFSLGLVLLVSYLLYFKYLNFITSNLYRFFSSSIPIAEQLALPLGVSFFTFTALSYVVDMYRERTITPFFEYLNYMTFFPKLISGPLVKISEFKAGP